MLGAAIGGSLLGNLGDRIGRARAMGVSILFYSAFAGLGALVRSCEEMMVLRFMVGLGVGGMWPNGVALVAECWPSTSRPTVAGILGAGINVGILALSQIGRFWPITSDSWRWIFAMAAVQPCSASSCWRHCPSRRSGWPRAASRRSPPPPLWELFQGELLRLTAIGILLATVPLVGAWAGSKWMIPWADSVAGAAEPGYKAATQQWWALGATIGSFLGAHRWVDRAAAILLLDQRRGDRAHLVDVPITAPLEPSFLPIVFARIGGDALLRLVAALPAGIVPDAHPGDRRRPR